MSPTTDPYLIPGTDCLDNWLGITDPAQLAQAESDITLTRVYELMTWRAVPGDFDLDHLQGFHRVIFSDVFPWAGEIRLVDMAKAAPEPGRMPTVFTLVQDLPATSDDLFARLGADNHLKNIPDQQQFTTRLAGYYSELNQAHPFREGNGRTQRAFWQQLSAEAGWTVDWLKVDPAALARAGAAPTHQERTDLATRMLAPAISPNLDHPLHRTRERVNAALLRSLTGRAAAPCKGSQPTRAAQPDSPQRRQGRDQGPQPPTR
jgi:cell filamentation protein